MRKAQDSLSQVSSTGGRTPRHFLTCSPGPALNQGSQAEKPRGRRGIQAPRPKSACLGSRQGRGTGTLQHSTGPKLRSWNVSTTPLGAPGANFPPFPPGWWLGWDKQRPHTGLATATRTQDQGID